MKQKLNLAALNKRKEEITEKEMIEVRAGVFDCECGPGCFDWPSVRFDNLNYTYSNENCPCGSIWVMFGLKWG